MKTNLPKEVTAAINESDFAKLGAIARDAKANETSKNAAVSLLKEIAESKSAKLSHIAASNKELCLIHLSKIQENSSLAEIEENLSEMRNYIFESRKFGLDYKDFNKIAELIILKANQVAKNNKEAAFKMYDFASDSEFSYEVLGKAYSKMAYLATDLSMENIASKNKQQADYFYGLALNYLSASKINFELAEERSFLQAEKEEKISVAFKFIDEFCSLQSLHNRDNLLMLPTLIARCIEEKGLGAIDANLKFGKLLHEIAQIELNFIENNKAEPAQEMANIAFEKAEALINFLGSTKEVIPFFEFVADNSNDVTATKRANLEASKLYLTQIEDLPNFEGAKKRFELARDNIDEQDSKNLAKALQDKVNDLLDSSDEEMINDAELARKRIESAVMILKFVRDEFDFERANIDEAKLLEQIKKYSSELKHNPTRHRPTKSGGEGDKVEAPQRSENDLLTVWRTAFKAEAEEKSPTATPAPSGGGTGKIIGGGR